MVHDCEVNWGTQENRSPDDRCVTGSTWPRLSRAAQPDFAPVLSAIAFAAGKPAKLALKEMVIPLNDYDRARVSDLPRRLPTNRGDKIETLDANRA